MGIDAIEVAVNLGCKEFFFELFSGSVGFFGELLFFFAGFVVIFRLEITTNVAGHVG